MRSARAGYARAVITADTLTTAPAGTISRRIDPMTRYVCRLHYCGCKAGVGRAAKR